jgi:hypothetical protein
MDESISRIARAAAARLAPKHGPALPVDVEAVLHPDRLRSDQYVDPISLGALIVSVANLGWTIYKDLRKQVAKPSQQVLVSRIRVELPSAQRGKTRDQVIELVVDEIVREAEK